MNDTEKKTVEKMIQIYCAAKHNTSGHLCPDCTALDSYAKKRLEKCIFGENKPNCQDCTIHCYQEDMKTRIQDVMRFSGPRIVLKDPLLALQHLIKGLRKRQHRKVNKNGY